MNDNSVNELLTRGVANIIPGKDALKKLLSQDKKLNVYLGIDPTATKIHLGHAVVLRKLQAFANLGHNVTFLIGDFTALIGDTSDKDSERPALNQKEVEENFATYKEQAEKIVDFSKVNVRHNSEWLSKLGLEEIVKLTQHFSAGDFISRELIRKRLDSGKRVGLHEFLYPVMQGYDSLELETDIQLGGTDQTFNMQAGRTLIKNELNKDSFILATEFLMGTDGRKMSKSWGNAIWLSDAPSEMFGKIMSLSDGQIIPYFKLATVVSLVEIGKLEERLKSENPMSLKKELAKEIVSQLYSEDEAQKAEEEFEKKFGQNEKPSESTMRAFPHASNASLATIVQKSSPIWNGSEISMSESKRLISQGTVSINDQRITDPVAKNTEPSIMEIGKKKNYIKLEPEK